LNKDKSDTYRKQRHTGSQAAGAPRSFYARERVIYSSVTEKERNTPAPQAEQRPTDAWQLCGKDLYVMKLPFSHSPSVIKPSQAMRTARHQNGGEVQVL